MSSIVRQVLRQVVRQALRKRFGGALVAGAALVAREARADDDLGVLDTRHHQYESPQHFAFEVRVAPYRPQIDEDPAIAGTAPYNAVFGSAYRVEVAVEMDWQALRIPHVGTLGPGLSIGTTGMTAKAKRRDNGQLSGEDTSLDIYPMYAVAVFRVDVLSRELHIPLVPYAKGGIGMALYRASNDTGTSVAGGDPGRGHTFGSHVALGLALRLNVFDPSAARNLDESTGINGTYLFGEYMMSDLKGIAQTNPLYVGTRTFLGGLAFEF